MEGPYLYADLLMCLWAMFLYWYLLSIWQNQSTISNRMGVSLLILGIAVGILRIYLTGIGGVKWW